MAGYAKNNNFPRVSNEDLQRMWSDLKEDVKRRYQIQDAIQELTPAQLRKTGRTYEGLCPFHVEKTPSFKVDPGRGNYKCWGCGENGDVIQLARVTQNLDFHPSIIFCADKAGIQVPDVLRKMIEGRPQHSRKRDLVRYESSQLRAAPGNLADPGLIKVPAQARHPQPRREFRLWNNHGTHGDRNPEVKRYFPQMVHEYRDIDGELLMCILRVKGRDKKFFIPARLMAPTEDCPGYLLEDVVHDGKKLAWVSIGPRIGEAKPVYGMEDAREWFARGGRNVLIVEGEKTRDAAVRMIRAADPDGLWLVLTPMGGSKSAIYADWKPFFKLVGNRKITVIQWADADQPLKRPDGRVEDRFKLAVDQMQTVIAQRALDHGVLDNFTLGYVKPPGGVKSGWDAADAEEDGWTPEEMLRFIKKNSARTNMANLELKKIEDTENDAEMAGREEPEMAAPFDLAGQPADDDIDWLEAIDELAEGDTLTFDDVEAAPQDSGITNDVPEVEDVAPEAVVPVEEIGADDDEEAYAGNPMRNPHFRCLGYLNNTNYFMSLKSGQVFELSPNQMGSTSFLHLAPLDWWDENFPKIGRNGQPAGVDWQKAADSMIRATYDAGIWEPRMRCDQGARIDGGTVVFHTGSQLYVDGQGSLPLNEFTGEYVYAVGPKTRMPDVVTPFSADSPEIEEYLGILSKLDWRDHHRELSIMALYGWTALSPICGVLDWRPHIWLDGPRGSGKSWVVNNLVNPVLGDFVVNVLSNSSEAGIRNMLNARSVPVVFDEAEGEDRDSRGRMDAIIKLARHSAVKSNSVVAQGVAGGGSHRYYSIASTFLLTSIVPQLEAAADQSRFARIKLASGRQHEGFKNEIELPAMKLITKEFSDRWIGRMLGRAKDYKATYIHMVHGLCQLGLERRVADVFGSFATGCWLMLRDGVPADECEAAAFLATKFNVIEQLIDHNGEITEDKDHNRLFAVLQSHEVRLDGRNNAGSRAEQMGTLIEIACGYEAEEDTVLSPVEARDALRRYGIRPGKDEKPAQDGELADSVLIHKNSPLIREILEKTPYARSYDDVMHQADGVKKGKSVRFGAGLPNSRSIIVPLKHFSIGVDH